MSEQLAYAILTPHTLLKSRTGGVVSRLITRTGLELVAARMFAPSRALVEEYAEQVVSADDPQDRHVQELIREYVLRHFGPHSVTGQRRRVMMLVFRGEDAVRRVRSVVGNFSAPSRGGETIRDSFGDLILNEAGQVRHFEPAVLAAPNAEEADRKLQLWARYSATDGGLLYGVVAHPPEVSPQRTLVLIKPDNFRFPSGRPGNVIDFLSRTGLFIVAIKVHRMSVAEAMEFYGPVRETLRRCYAGIVGQRAGDLLEKEFGLELGAERIRAIGDILGPVAGEKQFENIVRFMSGAAPGERPPEQWSEPGAEKCLAIVYEGADAVRKIRDVLGPTDPSKAPPGSIRREFGSSVMVNAAHASDSEDNARREMDILDLDTENAFRDVIEAAVGR